MNPDTITLKGRDGDLHRTKRAKREVSEFKKPTSFRFKQYQVPNNPFTSPQKKDTDTAAMSYDSTQGLQKNGTVDGAILAESLDRGNMEHSTAQHAEGDKRPDASTPAKRVRRPTTKLQFRPYAPPGQPKIPKADSSASKQSQGSQTLTKSSIPRFRKSEAKASKFTRGNDIKFIDAPKDPVEFTWWTVYQISHFDHSDATSSKTVTPIEGPPVTQQGLEEEDVSRTMAGNNNVREQARKRQRRWRASNKVRKNLNDMRSRVNREAKLKFGHDNTPEKMVWIEDELTKRRIKMEAKLGILASEFDRFPDFRIPIDVRNAMVVPNSSLSPKAREILWLVVDLLFPKTSRRAKSQAMKTVKTLLAAIDEIWRGEDEILKTVFEKIAGFTEAMGSIRAGLAAAAEADSEPVAMSHEGVSYLTNPTPPSGATRSSTGLSIQSQPAQGDEASADTNELMKVINDAVAILAQINDFTIHTSSDSNHQPGKESQKMVNSAAPAGIDLDAFLVTANAGPLGGMLEEGEDKDEDGDGDMTDGTDDETIADLIELTNGDSSASAGTRPDSTIGDTIDFAIDQLVNKRMAFEAKQRRKSGFDAHTLADKARKLLADANLRTNSVMTKAKSEAISHLYSQLAELLKWEPDLIDSLSMLSGPNVIVHAKSPTPIDPALFPIEPAVSTPSAVGPPQMIPSIAAKYKLSILSPPQSSGARTEEEQHKIRSYGFPPLPGSRIGTPRH